MNYIIINGVRSSSVKGLLISALPPISKPLLRTQVEEIDGRDGDIITTLGYGAYDKTLQIGLHGAYDVDDVIRFFATEGTVTFSNEPDKYYNFQVIEQIDFERLIRFRTATVTFHVQPFKYSAVDRIYCYDNQRIHFADHAEARNGLTFTAADGVISISGTAEAATEFYLPLRSIELPAGEYALRAWASGANAEAVYLRLIQSAPSRAESFGKALLQLQEDTAAEASAALGQPQIYNDLWFFVEAGASPDIEISAELMDTATHSFTLRNHGNTVSRPRLTVHGSGTVTLALNGVQILALALGDMDRITIDAAQLNAYTGDTLRNRSVAGDYEQLALRVGTNEISWTGDVTRIEVEDFTRWI